MTSRLLILLPPSETKTDGGNSRLSMKFADPTFDEIRSGVVDALVDQADFDVDADACREQFAKDLKITPRQVDAARKTNLRLRNAPVKQAIERYTGVLYDALAWETLPSTQQSWVAAHVLIHSAAFGLVTAADLIPNYRCSYNSVVGADSLKHRWRGAIQEKLREHEGPIIDLRSKGYVGLGAAPATDNSAWFDVCERLPDGKTRSLNHFNKAAKGRFVRLLAQQCSAEPEPVMLQDVAELVDSEFEWEHTGTGTIRLVSASN